MGWWDDAPNRARHLILLWKIVVYWSKNRRIESEVFVVAGEEVDSGRELRRERISASGLISCG